VTVALVAPLVFQLPLQDGLAGPVSGLATLLTLGGVVVGIVLGIYLQRSFLQSPDVTAIENTLDDAFLSLDDGPQSMALREHLGVEGQGEPLKPILDERSVRGKVEVMVSFAKTSQRSAVRVRKIESVLNEFYRESRTANGPTPEPLTGWQSMDAPERVRAALSTTPSSESVENDPSSDPDPVETNLVNLAEHYRSQFRDGSPIAGLFDGLARYDGSKAARERLQNACEDVVEFAADAQSCFEREANFEYITRRIQDTHSALYGETNGDRRQAIDRIASDAEDGTIDTTVASEAADIAESKVAAEDETASELLSALGEERDPDRTARAIVEAVREIDRANRLTAFVETTHEEVYGTVEDEPDGMAERLAMDARNGVVGERGFRTVAGRIRGDRSPTSSTATDLLDVLGADAPDREALRETLDDTVRTLEQHRRLDRELEAVSSERTLRSQASKLQPDEIGARTGRALRERIDDVMQTLDEDPAPDRLKRFEVEANLDLVKELLDDLSDTRTIEDTDLAQRETELSRAIAEVEDEYLNNPNYGDYNHIIPEHFLELVESFVENAIEQERSGTKDVARGYLEAGSEALDHTEALYTTREYSELLRTLDRRITACPNCGHRLYR
jgi:hypothetical protein